MFRTEETSGVANDGFVGWIHLDMDHPGDNFDYQVVEQALENSREFINLSSFDMDGDNILETDELAVIVIVAGYEESLSYNDHSIWGYYVDTVLNAGEMKINGYIAVGEKHYDHLMTRGVIAHEFGHLGLKLPDLYDTYSTGEDDWWGGLGYFCLMVPPELGGKKKGKNTEALRLTQTHGAKNNSDGEV